MVRSERLELSHLSAPEPKSGASTNSATTAAKLSSQLSKELSGEYIVKKTYGLSK